MIVCPSCLGSRWTVRRHPSDPVRDVFTCPDCGHRLVREDTEYERPNDPRVSKLPPPSPPRTE